MNNRSDKRKKRFERFKNRMKKTLAVLFCIVLLVFLINVTDMSTRRMIMCNDDRYAAAVSLQEGGKLRIDLAGERFILDIEPVIKVTDYVVSGSGRFCKGFAEIIGSKLKK